MMNKVVRKYYSGSKTSYRIENITFWELRFSPNKLAESEYWDLKNKINSNQKVQLSEFDFWKFYNQELILFLVCIPLLVTRKQINKQWLNAITFILCLFEAYVLFLFIADLKEYANYADEKFDYFNKLKEDILNSNDYEEFVRLQKLKNSYLYT